MGRATFGATPSSRSPTGGLRTTCPARSLTRYGLKEHSKDLVFIDVRKIEGAIDDIRAEQFIFSVDAVLGLRLKNKRPKINFSRLGGVTAGVVTMSPTGSGFDLSYGHDHIGDNL